jgi:xanthosine utilization system XapX-like protein
MSAEKLAPQTAPLSSEYLAEVAEERRKDAVAEEQLVAFFKKVTTAIKVAVLSGLLGLCMGYALYNLAWIVRDAQRDSDTYFEKMKAAVLKMGSGTAATENAVLRMGSSAVDGWTLGLTVVNSVVLLALVGGLVVWCVQCHLRSLLETAIPEATLTYTWYSIGSAVVGKSLWQSPTLRPW